jgi:hypothetical protein
MESEEGGKGLRVVALEFCDGEPERRVGEGGMGGGEVVTAAMLSVIGSVQRPNVWLKGVATVFGSAGAVLEFLGRFR